MPTTTVVIIVPVIFLGSRVALLVAGSALILEAALVSYLFLGDYVTTL
jgi:hypothetical protein